MQKRRNRSFGFSSFCKMLLSAPRGKAKISRRRLLAGQVKVGDAVVKGSEADYFIFTSS